MAEELEEIVDEQVEGQVEGEQDDGAEEAEGEDEVEAEAAPTKSGGRANERIRALTERAAAAEARAEAADREREAERARITREQEAARAREQEADENLPYDQKLYKWAQRRDQEAQQRLAATEIRIMDQADRASFESRVATSPVYAKYQDRVEKELGAARKGGQNPTREQVLTFLVGQDALKASAKKSTSKQKDEASTRVKAARGEPVRARSDATTARQRIKSLEERLLDQPL